MSKLMLPVFVGVFFGAFVFEMVRRNNPELGEALEAKAKRAARALPLPKALKESALLSSPGGSSEIRGHTSTQERDSRCMRSG
jgi:hypothetical protein